MAFTNPTPIRLGMVGALLGRRYRVTGRTVMGMTEAGETYYWNEFNLVDLDGGSATLVFEVTDDGEEWRLFTSFQPENPISIADATSKRVGDQLNLEGTDVRITLVSESRICAIEGETADDEKVGDVASYFNAQGGNALIVVSWTAGAIEFFKGQNVSYATVKTSFNLRADMPGGFCELPGSQDGGGSSGRWLAVAATLLALVIFAVVYWFSGPGARAKGIIICDAPPSPLKMGSRGLLEGKSCDVSAHEVVESAQVGLRCERHEYQLTDDDGNQALLVYGWKPGAKDWFLLSRLQPLAPLTPQEAAAQRVGDLVNVGGYVVPVSGLFRETVRLTESADSSGSATRVVHYGFSGQNGATVILVRWRENDIAFYAGTAVASKAVATAFGTSR